MLLKKKRSDLKPVLMEPKKKGIKDPYYIIEDQEQTISVVSPGKNGSEFNKTIGYFYQFPGIKINICLHGQGVLIMQRNDSMGEAKEFKVVTLNAGRQVEIPSGWGTCLVNVGRNFLVVLESGINEPKYLNTKPIIEKQGFVYYIVEKKGEIGFEPNPNYSVHPQITTV